MGLTGKRSGMKYNRVSLGKEMRRGKKDVCVGMTQLLYLHAPVLSSLMQR
jgi:hypothetical protein